MKLKCLHGYFLFEESTVGQVSDFISYTGLSLVPIARGYTFEDIQSVPDYTIEGSSFLDFIAIETYEGEPHEIFEANGVVYDFTQGVVVPISSISNRTTLEAAGNRFISPGLLLPGSTIQTGDVVKSYSAWFSMRTLRWLYSEVSYV